MIGGGGGPYARGPIRRLGVIFVIRTSKRRIQDLALLFLLSIYNFVVYRQSMDFSHPWHYPVTVRNFSV